METPKEKTVFKSESSIVNHPYRFPPKEEQFQLPTWSLLVILIICFFLLKFFIYITDEQRHGK